MNLREWLGFALSASAFAIAPFGHWISSFWYLVAVAVGIPGIILLFSGRNARRYDPSVASDADVVAGSNTVRGFPGAKAFDSHAADDLD